LKGKLRRCKEPLCLSEIKSGHIRDAARNAKQGCALIAHCKDGRAYFCHPVLGGLVPGLSDDADKVHHNGIHHCAFEFDSFDDLMNQQQQREISTRRNRRRT
jgi:hypothetical protein